MVVCFDGQVPAKDVAWAYTRLHGSSRPSPRAVAAACEALAASRI